MAYVELGQDNGGILLNLGEGGFAVNSALAFRATEFPELRFQVPQLRGWLTARGRIVWMSENKAVAGIQFLELPEASRLEIRKWASAEEEGEHAEAEQRGTMEPRTIVSETAYREIRATAGLPRRWRLPPTRRKRHRAVRALPADTILRPTCRQPLFRWFSGQPRERTLPKRRRVRIFDLTSTRCLLQSQAASKFGSRLDGKKPARGE